jgi:hypothetical protein
LNESKRGGTVVVHFDNDELRRAGILRVLQAKGRLGSEDSGEFFAQGLRCALERCPPV